MWLRWLRILSLVVGVALLGYTASGLFRNRVFLFDSVAADGVVVDVRPVRGGGAAPVIRFKAESGAVVDWVSNAAAGAAAYQVGEHVPVLYMPGAPSRVAVGRFRDVFGIFMLTGVVGLVLVVLGRRAALTMWGRAAYER